jgi:hypothetical protein
VAASQNNASEFASLSKRQSMTEMVYHFTDSARLPRIYCLEGIAAESD